MMPTSTTSNLPDDHADEIGDVGFVLDPVEGSPAIRPDSWMVFSR